jgi:hypothetical protein
MSTLSQFFGGGDQIPIEVWAVGGGGAGGGALSYPGGGGGAGQVLYARTLVPKKIAFTITIGAGGAENSLGPGLPGNSSIFSNMVAYGGIGGIGNSPAAASVASFGSGGGTSQQSSATSNVIPQSTFTSDGYVLANNGGPLAPSPSPTSSGGGGGALAAGDANSGGNGIPSSLFGISLAVGGGGSAGTYSGISLGGIGGGGTSGSPSAPKNGTANTGGGGAGGISVPIGGPSPSTLFGGTGGSGIVVIRYPTGFAAATVTGNAPTPAQPGYNVYRWNSGPATITFN